MTPLDQIAPAFIDMAHSIVWASVATVDADSRPRTRILHPIWEWDGTDLFGWIATVPSPVKRAHLAVHPEDLVRVDNPLKVDGKRPETAPQGPGREDFAT